MEPSSTTEFTSLAILISGGLDSAILLGESLRHCQSVHPLYMRMGLVWEEAELQHLRRFLKAVRSPSLRSLQVLEMPVADVYGAHWSISGQDVPCAGTADDAVFLPGRNVLLLSKAMLWCRLHSIPAVALASLRGNPFPDATPSFFDAFQASMNQATRASVRIYRPYAALLKGDLMVRGRDLPLDLTFSCIHPVNDHHCGICNKCAERQQAFMTAGIHDRTVYWKECTHDPP